MSNPERYCKKCECWTLCEQIEEPFGNNCFIIRDVCCMCGQEITEDDPEEDDLI